jgi:PDZ domain-containing protein
MTRRTTARLLAAGLAVGLVLVAALLPVPYVTVAPGPTVDVLGKAGDKPIVQVEGHRTYPTTGQLRLVTVSLTNPQHHVSLGEAFTAWVSPDDAVEPRALLYPDANATDAQSRAESAAQMVGSQDSAVAAALAELGYHLRTYAEVSGVVPGGPSDGTLKPRDRLLQLAGHRIRSGRQLVTVLQGVGVGDDLHGVVRRKGKRVPFTVTTKESPTAPGQAVIGVYVGTGFVFPFDVTVRISDSIGGPSAGLVFAMSVYDTLTPGSLTGGDVIAGTGAISPDGQVGAIGGIQQKIAGAADAGAELFLVPPANCAEALGAPHDALDRLRLVRAPTLRSAIRSVKTHADDPSAALPSCRGGQ